MTTRGPYRIFIPASELHWSFARSSGQGGQNVNKVSSKAVLKFNILQTSILDDEAKERAQKLFVTRINELGEIVIMSERFRDQPRNKADCLAKLHDILLKASERPKVRKKTKPTKSSQKRRLEHKKQHSEKKRSRQSKAYKDFAS